jgi:hypothetical protein
LDEDKNEVEEIEDQVFNHRREIPEKEVLDEVEDQVEDPFYTRTRETKYPMLVETHWLVKDIFIQALHMTKREKVDMFHAIHILEGKFKIFCRSQHGIHFRVTSLPQKQDRKE